MKLLSKLTLYNTLSKTAIVLLFIWLLPGMVNDVALRYTNYTLREQQRQVMQVIHKNGIDYYFQGDSSYGSYTLLKEEYISLEKAGRRLPPDTIVTSRRIVENDTLNYRVLTHAFTYNNAYYILEVGKTIRSIDQYNRPLQKAALYALSGLILCTLLIDLVLTRVLLRPLGVIIRTKLLNRKFPFKEKLFPVKTSTTDFNYLDASLITLMGQIHEAFEKEKEFTSNASHELMTPISILQNKLENLMDNELAPDIQDKIMGMMHTLNRLKKIVRSLLLISRIENDQFAKTEQVGLNSLVGEVMLELEDRLEARGIQAQLAVKEESCVPGANRDLLFQLLYNLINNAIRYNKPSGSIRIYDRQLPGKPYTLFIEDTGVGIDADDIPTIFDRFKKSGKNTGEGYGLGLSIVKSIAVYHGWSIEVQSTPGQGTVFSIAFPGISKKFAFAEN